MKATIMAAMMLTGCADLPWDPEDTMERVQKSKVLRAGIISTGSDVPDLAQRRFLALLATETGSKPQVVTGSAEALLPKIEKGKLDIVMGPFAADTPWDKRVTIKPAPREMTVEAP